jgi:hypothetical protein
MLKFHLLRATSLLGRAPKNYQTVAFLAAVLGTCSGLPAQDAATTVRSAPVLSSSRLLEPAGLSLSVRSSPLSSKFAFAPQSSATSPGASSAPHTGDLSTKGKVFKWVGVGLMAVGGANIIRGAILSNPCNQFQGPGVFCSSNYSEVRAASFGFGGAAAGAGLFMYLIHGHYRN